MYTIYHNPRCRKSREGLAILDQLDRDYQIRLYLKEPLTPEELKSLVNQLGIPATELVRTNEKIWKSEFKGQSFTEDQLIEIMAEHPVLIERPIVSDGRKAVVGRPPEKIAELAG